MKSQPSMRISPYFHWKAGKKDEKNYLHHPTTIVIPSSPMKPFFDLMFFFFPT